MLKKICLLVLTAGIVLGMCACEMLEEERHVRESSNAMIEKGEEKEEKQEPEEKAQKSEEKQVSAEKMHTTNYAKSEVTEKVTVVVDGKEITPTDNNGAEVETIIHDGIVYLPVKTVAESTGKAYYWDGPNYTVYIGNMEGALEHPTVKIEEMVSVGHKVAKTQSLTDNYGNRYSRAITNNTSYNYRHEFLLNMKYSKFKGVLYIPEGTTTNKTGYLQIIADGNTIYTSPEMTKTSSPINIDVETRGYNDVKIEFNYYQIGEALPLCLGDAGFYQ